MTTVDFEHIAAQLKSQDSKDRMLALASLRHVPAAQAAPLIREMIHDSNLQIRSMAVFALGLKPDDQSLDILVNLLSTDPDYSIRADAAGALGYLEDSRAFGSLVRAFY
ncbi:MAG: HEAT repeat domain-containing protein, partial [Nodosilinea sp.]